MSGKLRRIEKEKDKAERKLESKMTVFNLQKLKCKTLEDEMASLKNREVSWINKVKRLEKIER